ncbi:MAG: hypothetical protein MJ133_09425 [Lachnospiraceae bacterium]|nr:hypothetical protein [Lachnospiraceae bacterium]
MLAQANQSNQGVLSLL